MFHVKRDCVLGVAPHCADCTNAAHTVWVKDTMQSNPEKVLVMQRNYGKTLLGKVMMSYHNMRGRVLGIQTKKAHLYKGLPVMPRHEFYAWALQDPGLRDVYNAWVASGYARNMSPSINRIDTSAGYVAGNVEWLTHGENSRRGSFSKGRHL